MADTLEPDSAPTQSGYAARYATWIIRRRWWVLTLAFVATLAAATGIPRLGLATDYRVFFSPDNPDLNAYEAVENTYTKNDNVLFVVRPRHGDIFTPDVLEGLRALTEEAWQIPHSTRVDGVTNFQHTWADGDELVVEDLVGPGAITDDIAERARDVALAEPALAGRLVARDARTAGINVRISLPGESKDELPETVEYVRSLLEQYRAAYPDLEIHASGIAMMNLAFAEAPMRDMPFVMPLMFGAFVLAIILFLRSASGVASTLTVLFLSTATAMGIAGHLGVFLDPVSSSAPTIILTLAVADSIHILVTWFHLRRDNRERLAALVEAMRINTGPVFLTSITTVIGFLSLNFSDSPPFRLLGNLTALGVVIAWVYSMTVLPALAAILPSRVVRARTSRFDNAMERFADALVRRYRPILATMTVGAVLLSLSMARLRINDQYIDYFDTSLPIRVASDFTVDHLSGIYSSTYSLPAGGSQQVSSPAFLATVDAFADYLESRPAVVHVNSFTRTMKRLNRNMHGDDPDAYRLPDDQELAAQYLLLYELSLPYGLDVNDQIDVDKSALRLDVTYGDVDIAVVDQERQLAEAWLADHGTPSMRSARATGVPQMFGQITRRNIASMILGTGLGFLLIAGILVVALRSPRLGLLSLIPNILPAGMAFGVWAWLVGDVGFAVSIVAGLSLGIIVDNTVHFLSKYNLARRDKGMSPPDAVRYAFSTVGAAIFGTTFIVVVGFAMLGLSTFRVTSYMGLLTSLTVATAFVVDFLLLPTLLLAFDRAVTKERDAHVSGRSTTVSQLPRSISGATAALALATLLFPGTALAQAPDVARGRQIAAEAERRDLGWKDEASVMRMVLHNRNGDDSVRELRRQALETNAPGLGDRSLITFDAPRDVAGTSLLSHTKILIPDDQWLFLPALKRVKRISSANKSGPFVGSEFAYEDLASQELDKYDYRFVRDEACGSLKCHVVERVPRYENSGYTKQIVWWDTTEYRIQQIEFYDRKDALLKTLTYQDYQQYLGKYWRPNRMTMVNHQNGKTTELVFTEWSFANGFSEGDFTPSRLSRAR